jgi:hypothetical protein
MLTPQEPSATHLVNIPVTVGDAKSKSKLLIYTNDLAVVADSKNKKSGGALMIVPVPNPTNTSSFGLVSVSTEQMKTFHNTLKARCKALVPVPRLASRSNNLKGKRNALIVHKIGNYDISVAPNLADLKERIDWESFVLPSDFDTRLASLESAEILGDSECKDWAYVVAKVCMCICMLVRSILYYVYAFYLPVCVSLSIGSRLSEGRWIRCCVSRPWLRLLPDWPRSNRQWLEARQL